MVGRFHFQAVALAMLLTIFGAVSGYAFPASPVEPGTLPAPERSDLIRIAANDRCVYKCRVLREECVADANRAQRPDASCWDGYASCSSACDSGVQPGPVTQTPQGPDTVVLSPAVIPVGKWAEGITFDGKWIWVAESGQRTIARIDAQSGRLVDRVRVGRLPVGMVSNGDGTAYALVHTDKLVWRQTGRRGNAFARVGTCPEAITITGRHVWVLSLPRCSSESSQVIGFDLRSGRRVQSQVLGEWGQAVAAHGNQVWVAHARGPAITVVDQNTLGSWTFEVPGVSLWSITSNGRHLFAGGRINENNDAGVAVMLDELTQQEVRRVNVSERVAEIAADATHVVAVGARGTVWVLSADTFELQRTITLSTGTFDPRDVMILGENLVLSASTYTGENGALFVVRNWRPTNVSRPVTPVRPAANCRSFSNATDRAVCENRELAALDEKLNSELVLAITNTTSAAVGGTVNDAVQLQREQRDWLQQRDRCGVDVNCLRQTYQDRLRYFEEINQPE